MGGTYEYPVDQERTSKRVTSPMLFVLRYTEDERYDCPDYGDTHICFRYEDLAFSAERSSLDQMAADLNLGHTGYWTEKRANELRKLHPAYEDSYVYSVVDVSHLVRTNTNKENP